MPFKYVVAVGALFVLSCNEAASPQRISPRAAEEQTAATAGWARRYAGAWTRAIVALPEGGAVVLADGSEQTLFTIDSAGSVRASRQFDGVAQFIASGSAGEIFVGAARAETSWVARLEEDLSSRWSRRLVVAEGELEINGTAVANDGGLIVGGNYGDSSFAMKLDAKGELAWKRLLDPSDRDQINGVVATRDGGVICAGQSRRGPWLIRLDEDGDLVWHRTFPQLGGLRSVVEGPDGSVVAAGEYNDRAFVVMTGADGTARWQKVIDGVSVAESIRELSRDHYLVAALTPEREIVLMDIDSRGGLGWHKRLDPRKLRTTGFLKASSIATTRDAIYLAPQISERNGAVNVVKFDVFGAASCEWLADAPNVTALATNLAGEQLELARRHLPLKLETMELASSPVAIASAELPCSVADKTPSETTTLVSHTASGFGGTPEEDQRMMRYRELLIAKKYDELERLIAKFRREHTRHEPLRWEIGYFYEALARDDGVPEAERLQRLRAWTESRPESTAAQIALAKSLIVSAWRARGNGSSESVTDKGWKEYAKHLAGAKELLDGIEERARDDSQYWILRLELFDTGMVDVRDLARRAAAKGHHDPEIYRVAGGYLYPKWDGSAALYRSFAEEAASLTRATFGEGMYAWLAYQAIFNSTDEEYASDYAFDWERMKRGFDDIVRLDPKRTRSHHRYAWVAIRFKDRTAARALFQRPELAWEPDAQLIWRDRAAYDRAREWALRERVESFVETREWPAIVMQDGDALSFVFRSAKNETVVVNSVPNVLNRRDLGTEPVLAPAPRKPRVHVLTAAASERERLRGPLYLIGCRAVGTRCEQIVAEAKLTSEDGSGSRRTAHIGVRDRYDAGTFAGAPVLDEDGHVIAVVTGVAQSRAAGYAQVLQAQYLSAVSSAPRAVPAVASVAVPPAKAVSIPLNSRAIARTSGITMQNELIMGAKTYARISSFLVKTSAGVVAVSAMPPSERVNVIRDGWANVAKWTMWAPQQPKRVLTVDALRTPEPSAEQQGAALGVKGELPVAVLEPIPSAREAVTGKCLVVGCIWTNGRCEETVVHAQLMGGTMKTSRGPVVDLTVSFPEALPKDAFIGAAVLSEDGGVLGVLKGKSRSRMRDHKHLYDADAIGVVLQR